MADKVAVIAWLRKYAGAYTIPGVDNNELANWLAATPAPAAEQQGDKWGAFGYLRKTNSKDNPPHGWAFHFAGRPGDVAVWTTQAPPKVEAATPAQAEPVAYVDRMSLLWLSAQTRTPVASVATDLYKTAPGDGWVGIYTAPVAATPAPEPQPDTADAERYRWLRDQWDRADVLERVMLSNSADGKTWVGGGVLDQRIDAAIAASIGKGGAA